MLSPDRIRMLLSTPPHRTAVKVWRRLGRELGKLADRRHDRKYTTFVRHNPGVMTLGHGYEVSLPPAALQTHARTILLLAELFRGHRFDLLGSGWVRVEHGMHCRGLGGQRYDPGREVRPDRSGRWLEGRINSANLAEAQRIWGLVDEAYQPIDWHLDFKSGFRWREDTWYRDIAYGDRPGVDVKVPWELARMQHLPLLALAHALSVGVQGDSPYAQEFRNQVLDFIACNPPRYGVNWRCTMDVAIRVSNWLLAYDLFSTHDTPFDGAFRDELARSVYQHGTHIVANLEWSETLRGNHYLADVVGLLFVAVHLPCSTETDRWLAFAVQQVLAEMRTQIQPDGSSFEASTSYHRLSGEMLAYATALLLGLTEEKQQALDRFDHTGWTVRPPLLPPPIARYALPGQDRKAPLPDWYVERLGRIADFSVDACHPDGTATQIGDNDSGRFIKLCPDLQESDEDGVCLPETHLDHRSLVWAIDGLFGTVAFPGYTKKDGLEGPLLAELAKSARLAPLRAEHCPGWPGAPASSPRVRHIAYRDFGLYTYRAGNSYLCVRCGHVGQNGFGGHAHNDQLSFELSLEGTLLVVDPGSYVYTPLPQERNRFRSTLMHNTLAVPGREPNLPPGPGNLFCMWVDETHEVNTFTAEEFAGIRISPHYTHRRTLQFRPRLVRGTDACSAPGRKRVCFHLAPGLAVREIPSADAVVVACRRGGAFRFSGGPGVWSVSDSSYSPAYGVRVPNLLLTLELTQDRCAWAIERSR